MSYDYKDIPADCPYEEFWIVRNDGTISLSKAYKVADAFPDLDDRNKYDYLGLLGIDVDRENPWYMVPDGPYRTTRRYVYDSPAAAALVALERYNKTADSQDAILESIRAALPPRCPRNTPGCDRTDCSGAAGKACYGPNAPQHMDMGR